MSLTLPYANVKRTLITRCAYDTPVGAAVATVPQISTDSNNSRIITVESWIQIRLGTVSWKYKRTTKKAATNLSMREIPSAIS